MLLEITQLSVSYGPILALYGVSLAIDHGEMVALFGPNGAGKSTVLRAVSGLLHLANGQVTAGAVLLHGRTVTRFRTDQLVKEGVALVPEGRHVLGGMSVLENLEMGGYVRRDKAQLKLDLEMVFALFPRLAGRRKQKAVSLSGGEQQMLAIGRALMTRPKLLLPDEPFLGLSPKYIDIIQEKLVEINKGGTTVLFVEQNVRRAVEICRRAYLFRMGTIAAAGPREVFTNDDWVASVYLGS
jgi:branched-chain amino acid transport system ATP-binding protein